MLGQADKRRDFLCMCALGVRRPDSALIARMETAGSMVEPGVVRSRYGVEK